MSVKSNETQKSQWLERQVVEQVHYRMSVEQHATFTLDRCCLSVYQASDLFELTKNGYRDEQYLPLPCLDLDLVEISLLEVREPQLCWCCLI